jgi:dihydrofolate synthase/folylpolyglutamate synthase
MGLLNSLRRIGAHVQRAGQDFQVERQASGWRWRHRDGTMLSLPDPALAAPVQYANAASALAALHALRSLDAAWGVVDFGAAASAGVAAASVAARLQALGGDPALIVDVGHNPQAARALAEWLDARAGGRVHAVYGALSDKDVGGVIRALGARIDHWHLAGLEQDTPRGLSSRVLAGQLVLALPEARYDRHDNVQAAWRAARAAAKPGDRVLAFGSFFVAAAVLAESNLGNGA